MRFDPSKAARLEEREENECSVRTEPVKEAASGILGKVTLGAVQRCAG